MELIDERDWLKRFIAQFLSTTRDSVDRARVELESRPGYSGSQSPNHVNEAVFESYQNRQFEPIREATPRPEQATHKYEDALRVTIASFRLQGMTKDWWLRASVAWTLKNQLWTWNDFQEEFKKRNTYLVGFVSNGRTSFSN
ncbi:hypothetical protein M9H77_31031 [Catharanthus roseus]|uniref:Uncharacterized protein n=1 Tax=Catharanthus roseus TaxID=4058 RepID=A0ACB9ZZ94_CATRO|nr:hypothetical protein M9H77_31031 [Catharanthus roseus]